MSKREELAAQIKKAQAEGDVKTINKIKRAIYNAKVRAADEAEEQVRIQQLQGDETESFITKTRSDDYEENAGRKIRTDIKRPNLFHDDGSYEYEEQEDKLYNKPLIQRTRSGFDLVDAKCDRCNKSFQVHPTEYAQRRKMEDGQFVCDGCLGSRFRR